MNRYYLDTSIWLDYYEKRGKNGEIALKLIKKLIDKDFIIIYSDLHIVEFTNLGYNKEQINAIVRIAKPFNIKLYHTNRKQIEEAKMLKLHRKIPRRDILHALIAKDAEAVLVYTDKHFELLKDVVEIKKPQDLLNFFSSSSNANSPAL